ncbi:MAG TPA: LysR substrate-binding domain-containing protein [Solirubrobacteraceae bacterium]|nr:LysR substrate-binding domain-containing protein [Solirubrobacteraceae bacterium]
MLDSRRLEVFREVAQRRSFSGAGEYLALTQSGVSRQIAALEAGLGVQLLTRSARSVSLTPAGHALLTHTHAILGRITIAEQQLGQLAAGEAGPLRLACHPSAAVWLMPRAIGRFVRKQPSVELSLLESDSADSPQAILAGEIDLAVVSVEATRRNREWDELSCDHLLDDEWCLLIPTSHRLNRTKRLRIADLADETLIEGSATAQPTRELCAQAGFEPRVRFHCEEWLGRQGLVAAAVGITLIPRLALHAVRRDLAIRPLGTIIPPRRVYAIHHRSADGNPLIHGFLRELRHTASTLAGASRPTTQ